MRLIDADVTLPESSPAIAADRDGDTHAAPGLRPEVLADGAARRTKAMIHAALFKATGEAPTVGPYQVLKLLGEGGMGVVYAAYDDKLERKVALKLIRGAAMRRPDGRARTLREARALARLSHPNVVHVYQVGEVDDEIYVAMEFLTGPTLRAWLAAQPRTWREVLAVFRQAGEGLAAAHRQGVIHRDFKPANVIVGDDGRVRVLDFGLAHFFGLAGEEGEAPALGPVGEVTDVLLTQTGAVLGTPAYMAAEQFAGGRGDAKTDQFSFCTALYEALYGQRPFVGDKLEVLASAVRDGRVQPVKGRNEVPPWLQRVVLRGLLPDPALRWPGMDALLGALCPPEARPRWGRIAGVAGAAGVLLIGGVGYAFMLEAPAPAAVAATAGQEEAAAQGRAAVIRSQDEKTLVEARAVLASDPLQTMRRLAALAGDDASTWERARSLARTAELRGLPAQVLRAEWPLAEVQPLAGGLIGRDELGGVWRFDLAGKPGVEILPAGSATQVVVARDAPVWAVIAGTAVQVFGGEQARTIELGDAIYSGWRLGSDGRTLVATTQGVATTTAWAGSVHLWDLTRPEAPPRVIELAPETLPVIADDAAIVLAQAARGIRVIRAREGGEQLIKYRGTPWALSADGRFVVARPAERDGVMDVLEIATGRARRVEADAVKLLGGDDVLFTRMGQGRPFVRREALASGAVAWQLPLPGQAGSQDSRLVVDAAHEQFAVAVGEVWGVGDLRRGELSAFVTVPKDRSPRWVGAGALAVVVEHEVRIHRPVDSPVQVRYAGSGCGLAPGGGFAVVQPHDVVAGAYTRVALGTGATATFRCPQPPRTRALGGQFAAHDVSAVVDDAGQVAMLGGEGWSCWWDEQHGARTGARGLGHGLLVGLPRGVALADGAEVEVWAGPEQRVQRFTAAAPVLELEANASGGLLAVRSEGGVEVLHVDSGAVLPVRTFRAPTGRAEVLASALAWSPDGAQLAVLDKIGASLELSVWDVVGEPREVSPPDHVMLGGHVLEDSPGRPRNRMAFTPGGGAVVVTDRRESLLRVDLATHQLWRVDAPELLELHMRGESELVGVDVRNVPVTVDLATGEVSPLTANLEAGGSTRPQLRGGADGAVWSCAALGPGTLIEVAAVGDGSAPALRARVLDLAAAM